MKTTPRAPVAALLSVVAALSAGCNRESLDSPRQTVVVEVRDPGANARVVADTIATPIEQQINGVEKMLTVRSRSTDDGLCAITVTFAPGIDSSLAQTLVENRTRLALPGLPDLVRRGGVVVRKGSAGVGLILFLSSPNGTFDRLHLSNYANIEVKDELARAEGVAEVALVGSLDHCLRIWLDPDRLAAFELAATDVAKALEQQNLKPAAAAAEHPPGKSAVVQTTFGGLDRLASIEKLNDVVVQAHGGRDIRLRDVARVELGATRADSLAQFNGQPGVALAIHLLPLARPRDVSAAVQHVMRRLAANFPQGMSLDIACDFSANLEAAKRARSPRYVLLEMDAPLGASAQHKLAILEHADHVMRHGKEVQRVLNLSDNVFDRLPDRPCLLVGLAPAGRGEPELDTLLEAIRNELEEQVAEAAFRLRNLSRPNALPGGRYPIDIAVQGPESDRARSFARTLAERLREHGELTDVWTDAEAADRSRAQFDVDADAAQALGVTLIDVTKTLQVVSGRFELDSSGQIWQIKLQTGRELREHADEIEQLKVRNSRGELVPLARLVTRREVTSPGIEERLNFQPMVEITANPAAGISLAEIRTLCETLAADVRTELRLTAGYRLTWLNDAGAAQ